MRVQVGGWSSCECLVRGGSYESAGWRWELSECMLMLPLLLQVHTGCREAIAARCPLGQCRVSVLPPSAISSVDADGFWRASKPRGSSPLLVFINSKSGDNQVRKSAR